MVSHTAVHLALRNRLLTVTGIPSANNRAWTNKDFTPTAGTPYIEEDFVPSPGSQVSYPADTGTVEARGLYVIRWYGIQAAGITAIYTGVDAILAKFSPGTRLSASNGDVVRISGTPSAPYASQILPTHDGFAVVTITIPFWLLTTNAIAA